jgi:hypothetical protein
MRIYIFLLQRPYDDPQTKGKVSNKISDWPGRWDRKKIYVKLLVIENLTLTVQPGTIFKQKISRY